MKLPKATAFASFAMACLALTGQSIRASTVNVLTDQLTFLDLTDTVTFTFNGDPARIPSNSSGCAIDICTVALMAPTGFLGPTEGITFRLGEGSTTGTVSDDFIGVITGAGGTIKFGSDLPGSEATNLGPCITPAFPAGCDAVEDGTRQFVGSVIWTGIGTNLAQTITDDFFIQSDVVEPAVPEPASLVLLGSGLVMVLRALRRLRVDDKITVG